MLFVSSGIWASMLLLTFVSIDCDLDQYDIQVVFFGSLRVYGQFSIETIHERRKRNREFVLLIRIGKQNVKIIEK